MSCRDGHEYTYEFDGPPEDLGHALLAAAEWNQCGVVQVGFASDGIKILYTPELPVSAESTNDAILYTHVPHTQALIAHEMGHTFGLGHYGNGLMHPNMLAFHVSPEDCEALQNRSTYYVR